MLELERHIFQVTDSTFFTWQALSNTGARRFYSQIYHQATVNTAEAITLAVESLVALYLWLTTKPEQLPISSKPKAFPTARIAGYLPPAKPVLVPERVLITPAPRFMDLQAPTCTKQVELSGLTIRQLKAIARQQKLKGYGRMTKAQLIAALS